MANFVDFEIDTDEEALLEAFVASMEEKFPGWTPASGNYEEWMARVWARMAVETAELAADVPGEIFYQFGQKILNVVPKAPESATALTDWTFTDTAGYTVPEGTLVSIAVSGDERLGFEVQTGFTVAPGNDTEAGVVIAAVEPGEYANGADGTVSLIDAIPNVDSITLQAAASGGEDQEDPTDYLDRLADEATLLSPKPILPRDAEVIARRVSGVDRSLAIDLYDPDTDTYDNEKTITVAVTDDQGAALSSGVKSEVQALLESYREVNFVFHVVDPNYTTVDVEYEITALSGFTLSEVQDTVTAAIEEYLSPATWGSSIYTGEVNEWVLRDYVRINELVALIDGVAGVDRVVSVEIAETGDPVAGSDLAIAGPAPLTEPGTIGPV